MRQLTVPPVNAITNINPFSETGRSGLTRFGGYIYQDPLRELANWPTACKVYEEMGSNSAIVGTLLFAIKSLCRSTKWKVHPCSQKAEDLEVAEFVESCLFKDMDVPFAEVVNEALTMLQYGWALSEVVYKNVGGRIGIKKIALRAQSSLFMWIFAEDGNRKGDLIAMRQLSPPDFKLTDIPLHKCLLFRTDSTADNPQGKSILRNAVRSWKFKSQIEILEGVGAERDLAGLPIVKVPAALLTGKDAETIAAKDSYYKLATDVRRDAKEGVVLPSECWPDTSTRMYDIELLSAGGKKQINVDAVIRRYDLAILSTVLADFVMIGHEGNGSHALHTAKTDVFMAAIEAYLDIIAETINRHLIPRLLQLNPEFTGETPKLIHSPIAGTDLTVLGNYIKSLKFSGVPIERSEQMVEHLHTVADLPTQ